jgi:predicted Fe-S protein YdhL (DUF1289 family)
MTMKSTLARNVQPAPAPSAKKRSPCLGICHIIGGPYDRRCGGCLRSLEEIENWSRYTDEEKQSILRLLPLRASEA